MRREGKVLGNVSDIARVISLVGGGGKKAMKQTPVGFQQRNFFSISHAI